jgi:hypothetical protein
VHGLIAYFFAYIWRLIGCGEIAVGFRIRAAEIQFDDTRYAGKMGAELLLVFV